MEGIRNDVIPDFRWVPGVSVASGLYMAQHSPPPCRSFCKVYTKVCVYMCVYMCVCVGVLYLVKCGSEKININKKKSSVKKHLNQTSEKNKIKNMQNFKILQLAQSNKIMYNIYNDQAELYAPANCISIKLI